MVPEKLKNYTSRKKVSPNITLLNSSVVYSEVDFACVHGGRDYFTKSKGKWKMQRFALHSKALHYSMIVIVVF